MKSEPIFIFDRDEILQLVLFPNQFTSRQDEAMLTGKFIEEEEQRAVEEMTGALPYQNGEFIEQLNGQERLEFEVLADHPSAALIENEGRAVVKDVDGEYAEFIIRVIEDIDDSAGTIKRVEAEGGEYELNDEFVPQYIQPNVDLRTALGAVLQGTRVEVGRVEGYESHSVDLRNVSVKNAVYELLNIFGGERKFRVEHDGNRITRRYIDVYKRRGTHTGKRFEAGKDIISTTRVLNTEEIKTALYGRGASDEEGNRLTFGSVAWSKASGDPVDKPLNQTWIGDPNALAEWGYERGTRHKFGFYDGQEEDPAELLLNTWIDLQRRNKIIDTYEFEVIQLAEILGYDHEEVRLGDTCYAINRRIQPSVEVENTIIEYRHNLNDRKLSTVTLGNFRNMFDLSVRVRDIEKDYNDKRGEWDNKETPDGAQEKAENEAQKAIDEAQERIDQATEELEQTMENIAQGKVDLEDAEQMVQDAIDEAQRRIDQAKTELEQAIENIEQGEIDLEVVEQLVQDAMAEAQSQIDQAISDLEDSMNQLVQGKIDLQQAEALIQDTIDNPQNYSGDFVGDLIADSLIVRGPIISEDATITGTILAGNATLMQATIEQANIIDANIQDATITGTLSSVSGTFTGDLVGGRILTGTTISGRILASQATFVQADIEEGNIIDANIQNATITGTLSSVGGTFTGDIVAGRILTGTTISGRILASQATLVRADIEEGNIIDANIQNATITGSLSSVSGTFTGDLVGGRIMSNTSISVNTSVYVGNSVYLGQNLTGTKTLDMRYGKLEVDPSGLTVHSSGGDLWLNTHLSNYDVYVASRLRVAKGIVTSVTETGFCGTGGYSSLTTAGGNTAGTGVNFKVNKTYTPSSITLSSLHNNVQNVHAIEITREGFWLYITKAALAGFYFWRGRYTA